MAISTIVIMVIGVVLLIGLVFALRGGFQSFKSGTEPLEDCVGITAVGEACDLSCSLGDLFIYCCKDFEVEDVGSLRCEDQRLEFECKGSESVSCEGFSCEQFP